MPTMHHVLLSDEEACQGLSQGGHLPKPPFSSSIMLSIWRCMRCATRRRFSSSSFLRSSSGTMLSRTCTGLLAQISIPKISVSLAVVVMLLLLLLLLTQQLRNDALQNLQLSCTSPQGWKPYQSHGQ